MAPTPTRWTCALPVALAAAAWLSSPPDGPSAAARDAARGIEPGRAHAWLTDFQEAYPDRSPGSRSHAAAPDHVRAALADAGAADARIETLRTGLGWLPEVRNVLARVPGADGMRSIVLAAHHDTVGGAPGAIDDGGAVAVLVEVARVLASGPPPPCDVEIAVFDAEESGVVGAKAHAAARGADLGRVRAVLAIELVGWTHDRLVVHTIPSGFAWDADGIAPAWVPTGVLAAGRASGIPVHYGDPVLEPWYQPTVRLLGLGTGSDAGAFGELGVPAAMLAGSSLTRFYSGYHTHRDTLDLVSRGRLDDAARVAAAAAIELGRRAAADAPSELGAAYYVVAGRTLSHGWLVALALGAAIPAWRAARALAAARGRAAACCLGAAAAATVALGALGDVAGVLCGVPLVTGAALASTLPRRRTVVLLPALLPLLLQLMVVAAAAAAFGFRWRAGAVVGALLAVLVGASLGSAVLVRLHRPPRAARPNAP